METPGLEEQSASRVLSGWGLWVGRRPGSWGVLCWARPGWAPDSQPPWQLPRVSVRSSDFPWIINSKTRALPWGRDSSLHSSLTPLLPTILDHCSISGLYPYAGGTNCLLTPKASSLQGAPTGHVHSSFSLLHSPSDPSLTPPSPSVLTVTPLSLH